MNVGAKKLRARSTALSISEIFLLFSAPSPNEKAFCQREDFFHSVRAFHRIMTHGMCYSEAKKTNRAMLLHRFILSRPPQWIFRWSGARCSRLADEICLPEYEFLIAAFARAFTRCKLTECHSVSTVNATIHSLSVARKSRRAARNTTTNAFLCRFYGNHWSIKHNSSSAAAFPGEIRAWSFLFAPTMPFYVSVKSELAWRELSDNTATEKHN